MNVGPIEIVIVLVIALLVFGPKRLPQMGRTLGRGLAEFRHAAATARSELGIDDLDAGIDDLKNTVGGLAADIAAAPSPAGPAGTEAAGPAAPQAPETPAASAPEAPAGD